MKEAVRFVLPASLLLLLATGCGGSGGGLLSDLLGGGDSGVLAALTSGGSDAIDGGSDVIEDIVGDDGDIGDGGTSIATIHHPEPASAALFGGGLAGLAFLRRRRRKK